MVDYMTSQIDIYRSAKLITRRYGDRAADHVQAMIEHHLTIDDVQGAGVWLAIGQAVEVLNDLTPAGAVH